MGIGVRKVFSAGTLLGVIFLSLVVTLLSLLRLVGISYGVPNCPERISVIQIRAAVGCSVIPPCPILFLIVRSSFRLHFLSGLLIQQCHIFALRW